MREYISVVLSRHIEGNLLLQLSETNTRPDLVYNADSGLQEPQEWLHQEVPFTS